MKWPIFPHRPRNSRKTHRRAKYFPLAVEVECLEVRLVLSAAFDVTDLTALRANPQFAAIDGALNDGTKIGIAIIDSGVLGSHPDLQDNFLAFFDAVATDANADGILTPATSVTALGAFDPDGHGTHVSGTAASSNPNIGVATQAGLIGIRGLPSAGENFPLHDTLLSGLQWVEENHLIYNIKVVNMSLQNGLNFNNVPNANDFSRQIDVLESLGITMVSASGNAYADYIALGASFPAVFSSLSVANTWEDAGVGDRLPALGAGPRPNFVAIDFAPTADQLAASSQRSTLENQVAAPGSTIFSTWNDGGFNTISGTSMASPFVAGLVALVQDAAFTFGGRYLTVDEVVSIVRSSADTITDTETPNTQRSPLYQDQFGNLRLGTLENLPETGEEFQRVNALNAVTATRLLVSQNNNQSNGDTNNSLGFAIALPALNGTQDFAISGNIGNDGPLVIGADDVDLFRITVESPGRLGVRFERIPNGQNFDPYFRLFNAFGTEISNQNNAPNGNLYPDFNSSSILPAGTYYVGVSSFANTSYNPANGSSVTAGGSTGDYQFTVSLVNPDPNGVVQGATDVDLTSPNANNINPNLFNIGVYVTNRFLNQEIGIDSNQGGGNPGSPTSGAPLEVHTASIGESDVDFFRVVAPDSGKIFVEVDTANFGSEGINSFIHVFRENPNGSLTLLASNDDVSAASTDSFLEIDVVSGETYFVAVTTSGNQNFDPFDPFGRVSTTNDTGKYDLFLSFFNGDVNGTAFGAVNFSSFDGDQDGIINGVIGSDFGEDLLGANHGFKDVDFFLYTATRDAVLDVSVLVSQESENPLDGVLGIWSLTPTQGDITQIVDTTNTLPRTQIQISAGESLWISVTGNGNSGFNWAAPGSGTGGDTGEFQLSVQERSLSDLATLTNNSIAQHSPSVVTLGTPEAGNIGSDNQAFVGANDVDIFSYTPTVNQIVVIRTIADLEDSADTFLRVFNDQGQELAFNNDTNGGTNASEIKILLNAGQTYFIGVNGNGSNPRSYDSLTGTNASDGDTGGYSLLITEAPPPIYATGADATGGPIVNVYDARNNTLLASFYAYDPLFTGGVRVAVGDVTGDGVEDVVTAAGPGGGPHVRVFDGARREFRLEGFYNFYAFQPTMSAGLNLALGDVNNDGYQDIIVAPDAKSSPVVRVFSGKDGELLQNFFAYPLGVDSGVRVASGDVNGDGFDDIITAPGPGFITHVRVFDGEISHAGVGRDLLQTEGLRNGSIVAFFGTFFGGGYVAAGDVDGDNLADIIVGAGASGGPHVQVFNASNNGPSLLQSFYAYDPFFTGGVRVGATEFSLDNRADVVTAPGPTGGPHVRIFDSQIPVTDNIPNSTFAGGLFVAGSRDYRFLNQAQSLAGGFGSASLERESLTLAEVEDLTHAAITRFAQQGLSSEHIQTLEAVRFSLGDLPGDQLGWALEGAILLDLTAAGAGWFIDPTPLLNEEFFINPDGRLTAVTQSAQTGVDLLSVILHELGHQLGAKDLDADLHPNHLLADTIAPGQRRLPDQHFLDALFSSEDFFSDLLQSDWE